MKNNKKIVALMPIKMNNERLQGKNIKILGGKPLLRHQLDMILTMSDISNTYVYCSNTDIKQYLPEDVVFLKRDTSLDLPTANFSEIFESFMKKIDADIYVYVHATAPYISKETAQECIAAVSSSQYDSAFCAVKIQDFLWKDGKTMNFDAQKLPRSQDIDIIWRETSGIYVFTKESFKKTKSRIGNRPFIKNVNFKEAIDINELEDFQLAELFLEYNP